MKKNLIEYLTPLAAVALAGCAAVFSVFGLSKLFGGAGIAVIIMASILEFSKLVSASILHNYWKRFGVLLRFYLIVVVSTLILITSIGIYGFLIDAYQNTSDELAVLDNRIAVIQSKKDRFNDQLEDSQVERESLIKVISELSVGLTNNQIQYVDSTGRLITTQSSSTRRILTAQLNETKLQRDELSIKIETLSDSLSSQDIKILNLKASSTVASEIGPLRYLSKLSGWDMDKIVNTFALLFVVVFDPLAVTLIIVSNKIFFKRKDEEIVVTSDERKMEMPQKISPAVKEFLEGKLADEKSVDQLEPEQKEEIIQEVIDELEVEPDATIDELVDVYKKKTGPKTGPKTSPKPEHYEHPNDRQHKAMTRTITPE